MDCTMQLDPKDQALDWAPPLEGQDDTAGVYDVFVHRGENPALDDENPVRGVAAVMVPF